MTPSERLALIEKTSGTLDIRTQRDLEVIRSQMARIEGRLFRIAKRRSSWTRPHVLAFVMEDDE